MTTLSTDFDAALQKPVVALFGAVRIALPSATLTLIDGAGFLSFGGMNFVGRDPTFGVLASIGDYADGIDGEAPSLTIRFMPPSNAAMAAIASAEAQGSSVQIWVGALDKASGQVIGDPVLCFVGETDVAKQMVDTNTRALEVTVSSVFDRFFDGDEFVRMNGGFQGSIWPGEVGLQYAPRVNNQLPWGADAPRPALVTDVPRGGWADFGPVNLA